MCVLTCLLATSAGFSPVPQLFCDDVRSEVLKEHPEAKMVEVSNLLKARWSALDAAEKGRYEALACDKLIAPVV